MKAEWQQKQWVGDCPTGKRGFVARAGAKAAAHQVAKSGSPGLRPYQCEQCGNWHIGHKPPAVVRGDMSADEWYAR